MKDKFVVMAYYMHFQHAYFKKMLFSKRIVYFVVWMPGCPIQSCNNFINCYDVYSGNYTTLSGIPWKSYRKGNMLCLACEFTKAIGGKVLWR